MIPLSEAIDKAKLIAEMPSRSVRVYSCERCQATIQGPYSLCEACVDATNRERKARRLTEARSCIPAVFSAINLPPSDHRHAKAARVATSVRAGQGAMLMGPAGAGKTTTAVLALMWLFETLEHERACGIQWASAYDLAKAPQEHRLGADEAPMVRTAKLASVLVLDELGSEQAKTTAVQEVIHERHAEAKPTIVTTWLDLPGIQAKYGDGIARRLLERSTVIAFGNGGAK